MRKISKKKLNLFFEKIKELPKEKREKVLKNLISLLKEKRFLLPTFLKELKKFKRKNEVFLFFAKRQSEEIEEKVKQKMREIFGHKKIIKIEIDPELIGGFLAKSCEFCVDGSVKGFLEKVKKLWRS